MRTVNVTDHLPVYYFDQPPSNALSDRHGLEIILEPLQKWTCPEELVNRKSIRIVILIEIKFSSFISIKIDSSQFKSITHIFGDCILDKIFPY